MLAQEIDAAIATGKDDPIPVIIEHADVISAQEGPSGGGIGDLEARVKKSQQGIVEQLRKSGAPDIQQSVLANVITATLKPPAIEAVADREDVRIIRLNREEQVTS